MTQISNPLLPENEFLPDPEVHIFDGRIYMYGSHDIYNGRTFCLGDYVCYSADVNDLSSWKYEGIIYKRIQDPNGKRFSLFCGLGAPDVAKGKDDRYYLYYFCGGNGLISVASCDKPAGKYEFIGYVKHADGELLGKKQNDIFQFDPAILIDEKIYLYSGFCPKSFPKLLAHGAPFSKHGPIVAELDDDMVTIKNIKFLGIPTIFNSEGTSFAGHEFFEASSIRKINNKYYFVYSSINNDELCYAISDYPDRGFEFGGILISNGDIGLGGINHSQALNYPGNNHGSILTIGDKHYIFYHRQTNGNSFSRQVCAEKLLIDENGRFLQSGMTSSSIDEYPLRGEGKYSTSIVCHLFSKNGTYFYSALKKKKHPRLVLRKIESEMKQVITNFSDGDTAGFRYFSFISLKNLYITIKGKATGEMIVKDSLNGKIITKILIINNRSINVFKGETENLFGVKSLYFTFVGKGHFDFISFSLRP